MLNYLLTIAISVFVIASIWRFIALKNTPQALNICLPKKNTIQFFIDYYLFRRLFITDALLALSSLCFHWSLFILLLWHVQMFFLSNNLSSTPNYIQLLSILFILSSFTLLFRRIFIAVLRQISSAADYAWLILFILTAGCGLYLSQNEPNALSIAQIFMHQIISIESTNMFIPMALQCHIFFASLILLLFPFSKLFHFPSILINPSITKSAKNHEN